MRRNGRTGWGTGATLQVAVAEENVVQDWAKSDKGISDILLELGMYMP